MQKFYKITNENLIKEIDDFKRMTKETNEFIEKFFKENGIDSPIYRMGGNGGCNRKFDERDKKDIYLYIGNTEENIEKFGAELKKVGSISEIVGFRKSSKVLKKFQDECIKNEVIINLRRVRIGDYFKELSYGGYSTNGLDESDGCFYLEINTSEFNSITPRQDGFEEIKGSDYYSVVEALEKDDN